MFIKSNTQYYIHIKLNTHIHTYMKLSVFTTSRRSAFLYFIFHHLFSIQFLSSLLEFNFTEKKANKTKKKQQQK